MARAVGLDIGTRTIKVVELVGSPKAFKVQRVVTRPVPVPDLHVEEGELPRDPDELISETIRDIFQTLKLPKDDVCVAFDSGVTIFREIMVPFLEDDQIRKVVKFEAENHLHSHSIDDVIVNWVKTGESRDGSRLTIFASPKVELARVLGILRGAGLEPSAVDLDATALYSAYDSVGVFKENPNSVVVDVGARSTTLMLVSEGKPVVIRSFLLGSDQVASDISEELGVSLEEGRRHAQLPGGPHPDDLLVSASEIDPGSETEKSLGQLQADAAGDKRQAFVRKLHREAMRSLAGLQDDAAPERLLLSGGGSLLPGLEKDLEERFGLPAVKLDLTTYIDWKDLGSDPEFTQVAMGSAVGCGLRILGHNPLDVELLKEEFAPTNRFDVVKVALATFVTLLFVLLLALAYVASERKRAEQKRYRYVSGRAASLVQTAEIRYRTKVEGLSEEQAKLKMKAWMSRTSDDHTQIDDFMRLLKTRAGNLEELLGLGDVPQVKSALEVWLEVYRALSGIPRGNYGGWLRVLKLEVKSRGATVRIEVDNQAALDKIRNQFTQSEYFKNRARNASSIVEVGPAKPDQGRWQRDYEFKFREED